MHPPLLQALPKPTNSASSVHVTVREDTPWPGAGKMLGNLFEERNLVLSKDYLDTEDKKEDATVAKPPLKEVSKMGELTSNQKEEKVWLGTQLSLFVNSKEDWEEQQQSPYLNHKPKGPIPLSMTKTRQQWEEEMERLNAKYTLTVSLTLNLTLSQMKVNTTNTNMGMKH